ncbi:hypothetical protein [Janibacter sp. LM]|uniref:hypothetical protein n=1 Tax=Janibacter sp. LM TaxID=3144845 RepID=UPI0031F67766
MSAPESLRDYTARLAEGTGLTGDELAALAADTTPTDHPAALAARDGWKAADLTQEANR